MNEKLRAQLIRDEGCVSHAYQDSRGYWTIGVGHLIDERLGGNIPQGIIDDILDYDIETHANELFAALPWVKDLDPARQGALVNMAFNLGVKGLLGFINTLSMIQSKDWDGAAHNMLKSKWAEQVGPRALRLSRQILTGEWQ